MRSSEWLEHPTANADVATFLGLMTRLTFADTDGIWGAAHEAVLTRQWRHPVRPPYKVKYGGRSPKFFGLHVTWCAQLYSLAETPQLPPLPPTAFGLVLRLTRALLVSKDTRHLFVTPCFWWWKGVQPARLNCWRWKCIHPARPYWWWWKCIHPARLYCWRWKGIHPELEFLKNLWGLGTE